MNLIEKLDDIITNKVKWWTVIVFFILYVIILLLLLTQITPVGKFLLQNVYKDNIKLLDLRFGYSYEDAFETLDKLGDIGRSDYLRNLYLIDIVFPVVHVLFLASVIIFLFNKINPGFKPIKSFIFIPIIAGIVDLIENIFETVQILSFPNQNYIIVSFSSILTVVKHSLLNVSYFSIPVLALWLIVKIIIGLFKKNSN